MYQLEFVMGIRKELKHRNAVLTSGYMTGVPAGQHISLMMRGGNPSLFAMFNRFGQSKLWPADRLEREFHGLSVDMIEHLENKLSQAFNFVDGNDLQKSVVCDVMTRQRNFISYYPRTIEWAMPHIAPHMNPEYANFFLSLSDEALHDRRCVEEMFLRHYPAAANVFSNSNGLRSIASQWDARLLGLGQRMKNAGLGRLVPERWKNDPLELDGKAMSLTGLDGLWPLAEVIDSGAIDSLVDPALCREWLDAACRGDVAMYDRLVRLQALAWSLESLRRANA
jgi:hypothetical protein